MQAWRHSRATPCRRPGAAFRAGALVAALAAPALGPVRAVAQTHVVETVVNVARATGVDPSGRPIEGTGRAETPVERVALVGLTAGRDATAPPGTWVEFVHTVTNRGNYNESFEVVTTSQLGWAVELRMSGGQGPPARLGPLAPGDSVQVHVRVLVPETAAAGEVEATTLVVRAERLPQESRAAVDRTQAAMLALDPFTLAVEPAAAVPPGATLGYRVAFGNPDPQAALAGLVLEDSLAADLGEVLETTSGAVADAGGSGASVDVAARVDTVAGRVTWQLAPVPPGFRGEIVLAVRVAARAGDGTRIANRIVARAPSLGIATSNEVVTIVVQPLLDLQLTAATPQLEPGDAVLLTLAATNRSLVHDLDSVVVDVWLPDGFRFRDDGGRERRLHVATLPVGGSQTWTLAGAASERLGRGSHVTTADARALALAGVAVAAHAEARVEITHRLGLEATIVGRVYVDDDSSLAPGEFEGLPNVRLVLEDGTQCTTDARGRFHLEGVRPGLHVLRLDRGGLPEGLRFDGEEPGDRGTGLTRFVELGPEAVEKINFRARMAPAARRLRHEIAVGGERYLFDDFVLYEPGTTTLRPAASRLLAGLAPGAAGGDSLHRRWASPAVEETAPAVPEPPLDVRIRSMTSEPEILEPKDGAVAAVERVDVLVKLPLDAVPRLFAGDEEVSATLVGTRVEAPGRNVALLRFVGVPLQAGENHLRLEAWGDSLRGSATACVRLAGPAARIELQVEPAPADGVTAPAVRIRVLDASGVAVTRAQFLTAEAEGGLAGDDADPSRDGFQVRLHDGGVVLALEPVQATGARRVRVTCDGASAEVAVRGLPAPSDWQVTGLGQVSLAQRPTDQPLDDDQIRQGGAVQAGVVAEGRVGRDGQLTLGLDTRRERQALFGTLESDRLFPALGDAAAPVAVTPSKWPFFARYAAPSGHAQVGDFRPGWNDLELARFDRALTGFDADWRTRGERVELRGFAAAAPQGTIREDLPGRGIAGPWVLRHRPLVVHAERLTIETRDRLHSERVLAIRTLVRDADYTIDYAHGVVYLREPLPAADTAWNPLFLVALYGMEGDAPAEPAWGLRGQAEMRPGLHAGFVAVREEAGATGRGLVGGDADWAVLPDLRLRGEYARSEAAAADDAMRLSLQQHVGPGRSVLLEFRDIGLGFENPSGPAAGEIGTQKLRLQARWQLDAGSRLRVDASSERDLRQGASRRVVATDWSRDGNRWSAGLGWRLTHAAGDSESRLANVFAARTRRALSTRLGVEGGYQQALGEAIATYPTRLDLGLDARLTDRIGLRLRQEWDGSDTGRGATVVGLESRLDDKTAVTTRYEMQSLAAATRASAHIGLRTAFPLGRGWSGTVMAERGRVTTESDRGSGSVSLGALWDVPRRTVTLQYEMLSSGGFEQYGLRAGGAARLGRDWTLLGRERWSHGRNGGRARSGHDLLLGWAYRPLAGDEFHWLASVRYRADASPVESPEVATSRLLVSLQGHVEFSPLWSLAGGAGIRYASAADARQSVAATGVLTHARMTWAITTRVDAALGLRLRTRTESSADWSCGLESGVRIAKDLRAVAGYNFVGFADPDFAPREHTGHAGYLALRVKFDERSLGLARPAD